MKRDARIHKIAVVAFEGVSPFHLSVPCMVFADDFARLDAPRYDLVVCAQTPGKIETASGFSMLVDNDLSALETVDTVIVPAWPGPLVAPPDALLKALQRAHRRGARLAGLCMGALVLAEAGLLDGRRASTHWVFADDFAARYPNVLLDRSVLYVDEGDILTSAGTAAAIDCCLHLLRRDHGADAANRVARRMVVAPHRSGGQAQYIEQPLHRRLEGDRLEETLEWAAGNLNEPLCLDRLAEKAAMSRRNFSRRFRKATGSTVSQWILTQRLALVQRLLETTDRRMETIAEAAGFGSAVTMRQRFVHAFRVSPLAYRKQFRAGSDRLQEAS
ncbi:helix-turn-helix domain-containing protein [uncultured Nitratireductor sp.]|uniref:GlxA family transcriptional regulator n=1 Tax=uncultured Nitratireductor sp. TaxID=520953 RepID=UPI0025D16D45|nr:helix-turn-helix domain-containing protein [uncultured Nitratireductor sp.]